MSKKQIKNFEAHKIQKLQEIKGGNSKIGGDLKINTSIKGGVLNAAIGKGN